MHLEDLMLRSTTITDSAGEPAAELAVRRAGTLARKRLAQLAHEYAVGIRPLPARGQAPWRVHGAPVVPLVVHDVLCGWRTATEQDDAAGVLCCAGCGMAYLLDEVRSAGDR